MTSQRVWKIEGGGRGDCVLLLVVRLAVLSSKSPEMGFFWSYNADAFNLRSFDLSPGFGLFPSIQSFSPLCIATQITGFYWSEEKLSLIQRFPLRAMDRNSGQPQVKLSLLRIAYSFKNLSTLFLVINEFFSKTGAWEGAEQLRTQLAAFVLSIWTFPPNPSVFIKYHAKSLNIKI
jgi:hypothetical protein